MYTGRHVRRVSPLLRAVPMIALACVATTIAAQMAWVWAADRYLLTNVVVLSCALAAALTLIARFGWRRGIASALVVMALAWVIEVIGVSSGMPFGDYTYLSPVGANPVTGVAGHSVPMLMSVPLIVPCAWLMMAVPAFLTAQAVTTGTLAKLGWAVAGLVGWDFFLDPQFVAEGWWHWSDARHYIRGLPGIPVSNYLGWVVAASVLVCAMWVMSIITTDESPISRTRLVRAIPIIVYIWTWAGGIFANLVFFHRPSSALWGGVIMGWVVAALAVSWFLHGRRRPGSALRDSRSWS